MKLRVVGRGLTASRRWPGGVVAAAAAAHWLPNSGTGDPPKDPERAEGTCPKLNPVTVRSCRNPASVAETGRSTETLYPATTRTGSRLG